MIKIHQNPQGTNNIRIRKVHIILRKTPYEIVLEIYNQTNDILT